MAIKNIFGNSLILFLAMFIFLSVSVSAQTYLNVTITEESYQNVSFARDFDLEEIVEYSLVMGWINITNPSDETVYDIRIRMDNLANLATNVTWYDGRHGVQAVGLTTEEFSVTFPDPITRVPQPFREGQDLDRDNRTDFIWANATHLIIDLSSETDLISFELNDPLDEPGGAFFFDNEPIVSPTTGETLGWLDGEELNNLPGQINGGVVEIIQAPNTDFVVLHIPEIGPDEYSVFTYNATTDVSPPLNISTAYLHDQLTKVMANECFNVRQNATNQFNGELDLNEINISMRMQPVVWNTTSNNFSFQFLFEEGDWDNVDNETHHNHTWYWNVNGGTLAYEESTFINYTVCAPVTVPNSSTYRFLVEELSYRTEGTITGVNIDDIKAGADVRFNLTKRIDRPTDTEFNRYVTWESRPSVVTSTDIQFNLTKVSVWVTSNHDPNEFTVLKDRYFPQSNDQIVNRTQRWFGDNWYFNYTDGSHPDAPPPIVWMMPYYHIADIDDQIERLFITTSGEDYYFKYIYVVNGYWLEVEKNVTNIGADNYSISLFVWNIGPGYTPRDLTVTVYDFIPQNFTDTGFEIQPTGEAVITEGAFVGTSLYWDIPSNRTPQNASFAPRGQPQSTWNVSYNVTGFGEYRVSDLFIVGLDPRLVDGASSNEVVSVLSSMTSRSTESVYIMVVFALVAINILNYVFTKKRD